MEKRIGVIAILIHQHEQIPALNRMLSEYGEIILGRMGLPLKDRDVSVISLIIEGDTDQIGALTGRIGRLDGITVKSVLTPKK